MPASTSATSGARSTNSSTDPSGIAGGLQAGYNWQNGQFVFGGETDLQFSGADDTFAPWKFSNPWFGTLRARAGYAMNNILFYGTAGLAYGGVEGQFDALTEDQDPYRLDRRPRHGSRLHAELVGQGRVSLCGSGRPRLFHHRHRTMASESSLLRFGVNYHF